MEALKHVCAILAALSLCDLIALFVYGLRYVPTGLSEGICYPFYIPMKMQVALLFRLVQIAIIVFGIIFFVGFSSAWHIGLSIATGVLAVINSLIFSSISY